MAVEERGGRAGELLRGGFPLRSVHAIIVEDCSKPILSLLQRGLERILSGYTFKISPTRVYGQWLI